jgi:uncharacterized protein YndB with AHSA1/START domain
MRLPSALVPTFRSDRSWRFDVAVDDLWSRLTATDRYPEWWPWLADFDADRGFRAGSSWTCTVVPPLPYRIRFRLSLDEVEPARLVTARISGDIRGDAVLTVGPAAVVGDGGSDGGSEARLRSRLSPANPLLQGVGVTARPLVLRGHDWVLDNGQRQFVERAFAPAPDP